MFALTCLTTSWNNVQLSAQEHILHSNYDSTRFSACFSSFFYSVRCIVHMDQWTFHIPWQKSSLNLPRRQDVETSHSHLSASKIITWPSVLIILVTRVAVNNGTSCYLKLPDNGGDRLFACAHGRWAVGRTLFLLKPAKRTGHHPLVSGTNIQIFMLLLFRRPGRRRRSCTRKNSSSNFRTYRPNLAPPVVWSCQAQSCFAPGCALEYRTFQLIVETQTRSRHAG